MVVLGRTGGLNVSDSKLCLSSVNDCIQTGSGVVRGECGEPVIIQQSTDNGQSILSEQCSKFKIATPMTKVYCTERTNLSTSGRGQEPSIERRYLSIPRMSFPSWSG